MLDLAGPPSTLQPHPAHPSLQIFTKKDKKDGHPPPPRPFFQMGGPEKRALSGPSEPLQRPRHHLTRLLCNLYPYITTKPTLI
jgi:hypothetical protein